MEYGLPSRTVLFLVSPPAAFADPRGMKPRAGALSRRKPGPTHPPLRAAERWTPAFARERVILAGVVNHLSFSLGAARDEAISIGVGSVAPRLLRFARNDRLYGIGDFRILRVGNAAGELTWGKVNYRRASPRRDGVFGA